MSEELKACQNCGLDGPLLSITETYKGSFYALCHCGYRGRTAITKTEAIELWNRPIEDALREKMEEFRKMVRDGVRHIAEMEEESDKDEAKITALEAELESLRAEREVLAEGWVLVDVDGKIEVVSARSSFDLYEQMSRVMYGNLGAVGDIKEELEHDGYRAIPVLIVKKGEGW